ncbi:AraC family transcriptional regulator [Pseudochelatococcus lubricantis]|uniref:helix-turn-helix transcriptional regulator n=1 Tax=Pseudochelatococcus lubricantis TaxID=1538102 RepID=UPI0035F028C6
MMGRNDMRLWRDSSLFGGLELLRASCFDHRYSPHFHDEFVVAAFRRGAQRHRVARHEGVAHAGTVMIIHPGEVHSAEAAERNGIWEHCAFYPSTDTMEAIAADMLGGSGALDFGRATLRTEPGLARSLLAAHRVVEATPDAVEKQSAVYEALALLIRRYGQRAGRASRPQSPAADMSRAVAFMNDCHDRRLTVDEIARVAGLSEYHFMRAFRAQSGLTVHRYLTQVRLGRAKALLERGVGPAEVAVAVGFFDQSHLTNQFRNWFGVTPRAFALACC